jgi:hypothetical protein
MNSFRRFCESMGVPPGQYLPALVLAVAGSGAAAYMGSKPQYQEWTLYPMMLLLLPHLAVGLSMLFDITPTSRTERAAKLLMSGLVTCLCLFAGGLPGFLLGRMTP